MMHPKLGTMKQMATILFSLARTSTMVTNGFSRSSIVVSSSSSTGTHSSSLPLLFVASNIHTSTSSSSSLSRKSTRSVCKMVASPISSSSSQTKSSSSSTTTTSPTPLETMDPELYNLIQKEDHRQKYGLELIASENFASSAVRQALGSCLTNKYSEGNIGKRYYGGNEYIDQIESLCISRALELYNLSPEEWGVNVQPYSGSPANFAVYTALLNPHDRIMGLDLPSGGHLTHGFQTLKGKKVSATSVYFDSMPYVLDKDTGYIDYDDLEYRAKMFLPKMIIAGASAYPRDFDYERLRQIADDVNAYLMVDMAHIAGLVAGKCLKSPFEYADIVTSTTHKTLRGPRSGIIFAKKELMDKIDFAVFPSLQGGPHNHQIAAVATALKEANTDEFCSYTKQIISNAQALGKALVDKGHVIATGGTENHLLLWDVRPFGLTGNKVEKVLEMVSITTNKNSLQGDVSAINPGGVRLGTPALTSRGLDENDFEMVADFLDRGYKIALKAQDVATHEWEEKKKNGDEDALKKSKVLLKDYLGVVASHEEIQSELKELRGDVEEFASKFDMPGDLVA